MDPVFGHGRAHPGRKLPAPPPGVWEVRTLLLTDLLYFHAAPINGTGELFPGSLFRSDCRLMAYRTQIGLSVLDDVTTRQTRKCNNLSTELQRQFNLQRRAVPVGSAFSFCFGWTAVHWPIRYISICRHQESREKVYKQYGPKDRLLLLCRGASSSVTVTHTRVAWVLHLWYYCFLAVPLTPSDRRGGGEAVRSGR